jgi:hypothetical protein
MLMTKFSEAKYFFGKMSGYPLETGHLGWQIAEWLSNLGLGRLPQAEDG